MLDAFRMAGCSWLKAEDCVAGACCNTWQLLCCCGELGVAGVEGTAVCTGRGE